jgi:hypothetical protein
VNSNNYGGGKIENYVILCSGCIVSPLQFEIISDAFCLRRE